jgi:serine phosphatase RsbU (regulator of sigma subunit)
MDFKMRQLFLLISFFFFANLPAQMVMGKINKDSLEKVVASGIEDTGKVNAYLGLGRYYRMKDAEKSLSYFQQGDQLAAKLSFIKGRAKAHNSIAVYYKGKNQNDSMFAHYKRSLDYAKEANDDYQVGLEYYNEGQAFFDVANTDAALSDFVMADSVGEKINSKYLVLAALNSISGIYFTEKNYVQAKAYTQRILDYGSHVNDDNTVAAAYANFGNFSDAEGKSREALDWYFLAEKKYGEKGMIQLPQLYGNIGGTYYKMNKYDSSIYYSKMGIAIKSPMISPADIAMNKKNISASFLKLNQVDSALYYGISAISLATKANSLELQADLHGLLSEIYEAQKDYEQALIHARQYAQLQDSINTDQDLMARNKMLVKFQTARTEKDLAIANEGSKRTKIVFTIVGIGAFLVLVLLFCLYLIKKKANKQLESQNEEILLQKDEISTKNKEITDSINYARRIQVGILPDEKMLSEIAPENFVLNIPRDIVSGDFYWFAKKENRFYIAVADCTGHGVPGALVSVVGMNLLNQVIAMPGLLDTGEVLSQLHRLIIKALNKDVNSRETNDGMDIGVICIDRNKNEAEYSGARRPIFISSEKGIEMLKGDRDSVGGEKSYDDKIKFSVQRIALDSPKTFYLTTDGFVDQFGESSNKKFLTKRFHELLESFRGIPMPEQQLRIGKAFKEWKGNLEQVDDVLVLGFKTS